jgi:hypothetical protein
VAVPDLQELLKVYTVSMASADKLFSMNMVKDPLPMLAMAIGVLAKSEASDVLPDADKAEVSDALRFLAERVATLTAIADKSAPQINFTDALPRGSRRGPARTLMFDVARGLARRVPLTKLMALDGDVRPYLASLIVSALHRAGDKLIIP